MDEFTIDPSDVNGLVCSHKTYVQTRWEGPKLREVRFFDGRPDLEDVGPPEGSRP